MDATAKCAGEARMGATRAGERIVAVALWVWIAVAAGALLMLFLLLVVRRRGSKVSNRLRYAEAPATREGSPSDENASRSPVLTHRLQLHIGGRPRAHRRNDIRRSA